MIDLDKLFYPSNVCLIGVSDTNIKGATPYLYALKKVKFNKPIYCVNKFKRKAMFDIETYPSVLDVPDDKIEIITESLEANKAIINKKGRVKVDFEECIDCGACVSLCPTDALYMSEENRLEFAEDKCIACLLCVDSCPRLAIKED